MVYSPSLHMYKNLLKLAKRLPANQRQSTIEKIREEYRKNSSEHSQERIMELVKKAESTLGYLKIVTPKRSTEINAGKTTFVSGNPANKGGTITKATSNWHGKNLDPDAVSRHYSQLKRAGFSSNKDVIGKCF